MLYGNERNSFQMELKNFVLRASTSIKYFCSVDQMYRRLNDLKITTFLKKV